MPVSQTSSNYHSYGVDNRDTQAMYSYLEARIDALKQRVAELERENEILRSHLASDGSSQA